MATRTADKAPTQQTLVKQVLEQLSRLGGQLASEDDITWGDVFTIPRRMTLVEAARFLNRRVEDEEQTYRISRIFKFRPWDGAAATASVIKAQFGFTMGRTIKSFFGDQPPELHEIEVDVGETMTVPWGQMYLPFVEDCVIVLGATHDEELGSVFRISAQCKRKDRHIIEGLFHLIQEELVTNSIYRGKAITGADTPGFIDTSHVSFDDVVYSQQVMMSLSAHVWAGILYPEAMDECDQAIKRVITLAGTYGVGKTLAAYLTAKMCKDHGWTFIFCRAGQDDWLTTIMTARIYGPAVVLIEDADLLVTKDDPHGISRLLDTFDGVDAKGQPLIVILTTNHIEKIHKGMMRPGRMDSLITLGALDRPGVERLARRVIGDNLDDDVDFDKVFKACDGYMPAFVKEVFDRSIRFSIVAHQGQVGKIDTEALLYAAGDLRPQFDLMLQAPEAVERSGLDGELTGLVRDVVRRQLVNKLNDQEMYDVDGDYMGKIQVG